MKVLGIGEVILDKTCVLQSYPEEGSKVQPMKTEYSIGGPVAAALTVLSRLGGECALMASVADDTFGAKIKNKIQKEGIKFISNIQKQSKSNTILINSENGSRTIIRDSVSHTPIKTISKNLLDWADLIIFDRHEFTAYEYVIAHKRPETKVIIDPSSEVSEKTMKMFETADFPIIPVESLTKILRHESWEKNLEYLHSITRKTIIVTAGDKGSMIYDGLSIELVPAVVVDCIDANGAGDVFRGAFGYGIMNNWDVKRSTIFANIVAGLQCTKIGNGSAIPQKQEIEEFEKIAIQREFLLEHIDQLLN